MSHPSPTSSDMTQAEEDAFIDSFIDYTGGMPETPTRDSPTTASTFEGDKPTPSEALDPLAVQILVMRLDTLRSLRGQENAPILDLMRAKINREAASSTLQRSLLDRLLTVGPAASEPVPVRSCVYCKVSVHQVLF
jgi:hypothetical protein